MEKEKLFDSLDGLFAYDIGCTDSGIKDETLRREVKKYLDDLSEDELKSILAEFIYQQYTCSEAVKNGYGIEDEAEFLEWLNECMDICL